MKKQILITLIAVAAINVANAQIGGMQKNKTKDATTKKTEGTKLGSAATSKDTKAMVGLWKVDGVIVTTENEALKSQITAQEEQYNSVYKGYNWDFKADGSISITAKDPNSGKVGTGTGKYELHGEKILMEINNQPGEYDLKFEDGQMLLVNLSPLNTIYYVFVKVK